MRDSGYSTMRLQWQLVPSINVQMPSMKSCNPDQATHQPLSTLDVAQGSGELSLGIFSYGPVESLRMRTGALKWPNYSRTARLLGLILPRHDRQSVPSLLLHFGNLIDGAVVGLYHRIFGACSRTLYEYTTHEGHNQQLRD